MLTIRLNSDVPLVEQIASGLRTAIATGEVSAGDSLPTVRQLAGDLGVNLNTVARAYRELEQDGLVTTTRGRGTCVVGPQEKPRPPKARALRQLTERLKVVFADARLAGLNPGDVQRLVEEQIELFWKPE